MWEVHSLSSTSHILHFKKAHFSNIGELNLGVFFVCLFVFSKTGSRGNLLIKWH